MIDDIDVALVLKLNPMLYNLMPSDLGYMRDNFIKNDKIFNLYFTSSVKHHIAEFYVYLEGFCPRSSEYFFINVANKVKFLSAFIGKHGNDDVLLSLINFSKEHHEGYHKKLWDILRVGINVSRPNDLSPLLCS